jgi:hypothetical protein
MDNLYDIFGARLFIARMMNVDERSAKLFASDPEPSFLVVNDPLDWVDAEKGLDLAPSKGPSGASDPA